MTDDAIREVYRRIAAIRRRDGEPPDHYYACVILSDLSSEPFDRVWRACIDEDPS